MREIFSLFTTFFKIGIMTFGGGYAMLPMIQREIVEKHSWATDEEIMNYYAVGQCTPGVIAVNTATFIGYYRKGILGSLAATLGVVAPSLLIITIIAAFIQEYSHIPVIQYAFSGIKAAVAVLIINAVVKLWKTGVKGVWGAVIFAVVLAVEVIFDISSIIVVVAAVLIGIFEQIVRVRSGKEMDE